jgi:hypothetical protein
MNWSPQEWRRVTYATVSQAVGALSTWPQKLMRRMWLGIPNLGVLVGFSTWIRNRSFAFAPIHQGASLSESCLPQQATVTIRPPLHLRLNPVSASNNDNYAPGKGKIHYAEDREKIAPFPNTHLVAGNPLEPDRQPTYGKPAWFSCSATAGDRNLDWAISRLTC